MERNLRSTSFEVVLVFGHAESGITNSDEVCFTKKKKT